MDLPRGITIVSDRSIEPGEAIFSVNGRVVGKITNIKCPVVETYNIKKIQYDPSVTIPMLSWHWIDEALVYFKGNKTQTAKALGIGKSTLERKLLDRRRANEKK